mgnify:FL=1
MYVYRLCVILVYIFVTLYLSISTHLDIYLYIIHTKPTYLTYIYLYIPPTSLAFHPAREYLVPRQTMTEVNTLIKKIATEHELPVFDWENVLLDEMKLNPKVVQWDIVHQSVDTSFLMANQLLMMLNNTL